MRENKYVVVDTITGQWLTEPIPYADAASLAYHHPATRHVEEVED